MAGLTSLVFMASADAKSIIIPRPSFPRQSMPTNTGTKDDLSNPRLKYLSGLGSVYREKVRSSPETGLLAHPEAKVWLRGLVKLDLSGTVLCENSADKALNNGLSGCRCCGARINHSQLWIIGRARIGEVVWLVAISIELQAMQVKVRGVGAHSSRSLPLARYFPLPFVHAAWACIHGPFFPFPLDMPLPWPMK